MIAGVGVDMVRIERMEKSLGSEAFWQRVFGEEERAFLLSLSPRKQPESAGANFAAKEAFLKACGTGIGGFALCEIQVLRAESGAPYYALTGQAAAWLEENRLTAHLSLSHDGGLAQAFTILEQTGD